MVGKAEEETIQEEATSRGVPEPMAALVVLEVLLVDFRVLSRSDRGQAVAAPPAEDPPSIMVLTAVSLFITDEIVSA